MSTSAMEIRLLRYFLAVAEARSFTVAAHPLGISRPTLSHQIRKLEACLGTPLFERAARFAARATEGSCPIGENVSTNAGGINVLRPGNPRELTPGLGAALLPAVEVPVRSRSEP